MKKLLLSLNILFCVLFVNAQDLQTERDTLKKPLVKSATTTKSASAGGSSSGGLAPVSMPIMPSPTAASLVRNATASPNLYTGAVNVSIPLYTLPAQGMNIPIGLMYQSNGVKINEKNGPLGMTWSLQGGGAVARIVRGYPDEFKGEIKKESKTQLPFGGGTSAVETKNIKVTGSWYDISSPNIRYLEDSENPLEAFKNYVEFFTKEDEWYDTEKDRYLFSAPGLSGSFFIRQQASPDIHCDEYVRIEPIVDKSKDPRVMKGFEITKRDGTIYVFGMSEEYMEEQTYETLSTNVKTYQKREDKYDFTGNMSGVVKEEEISFEKPYRAVWYLKEIITPYGADKITYKYGNSETVEELQGNSVTLERDEYSQKPSTEQSYTFSKTITTTYFPKRLIAISSAAGHAEFSYSRNNTITSVYVKKNNNQVKHYRLSYLDVNSRISEPNDTVLFTKLVKGKHKPVLFDTGLTTKLENDNLNKRFFLSDIFEVNTNQTDSINIFHFEYNKPEFLPQRCSKFQNSFGFCRRYGNFKENFISEKDQDVLKKFPNYKSSYEYDYNRITINGLTDWVYNYSSPEIGLLKNYKNATGAVMNFSYKSEAEGAFLTQTKVTDGDKVLQNLVYEYDFERARSPYGIYSFEYRAGYEKKGYNIWCGTESAFTHGSYWEFDRVTVHSTAGKTEYIFTSPLTVKKGEKIYDNRKSEVCYYSPMSGKIEYTSDIEAGRPCNRINLRGKPLKITSYNKNNVPVFKKEFVYKIKRKGGSKNSYSFTISNHNTSVGNDFVYVAEYSLVSEYLRPVSVTTTRYTGKDMRNEMVAKTSYFKYHGDDDKYNWEDYLFNTPVEISRINLATGDTLLTNILIEKKGGYNIPNFLPRKQETFKNGKQISGTEIIYDDKTRLPKESKSWINGQYETTTYYDSFDTKGRLQQAHGRDSIPVSYRYKDGLPELTARNATYDKIKEGKAEELRKNLPNAFIESIEYTPEGFVDSKTDANRYTQHYEYDDFGRLKLIRNHDQSVVQAYDYQYGKVGLEAIGTNKLGIGQMVIGNNFVVGGYTETKTQGLPSAGKNYTATHRFKKKNSSFNDRTSPDKVTTTIEYHDGLGRAIQQIAVNALPQQYSMVQAFEYDSLGRQPVQYRSLPMLSDEKYKSNWKQYLKDKYETAYKAETTYDDFYRVHRQGGFGENYSVNKEHASIINYGVNDVEIKSYTIELNSEEFTEKPHSIGSLLRTSVYHEGITNVVYKNTYGQVVRKAAVQGNTTGDPNHESALITDYVYDDYGNLRAILPPQAKGDISKKEYVYKFHYDTRNRLVKKEIPGAGSISMQYDELDRLIRETDAKGLTTYIKYDELSRPVETGFFSPQTPPLPEEGGSGKEVVLSRTYYDNYDFDFAKANPCSGEHAESNLGRITGTETRVLDTDTWIKAVSYYDKEGRIMEAISQNNSGGIDKVRTAYDFEGKVTQTKVSKTFNGKDYSSLRQYDYAASGELKNVHHGVNGQSTIVLSSFTYKNDGSLAEKRLHNGKIKTNYTYDELDRMVKAKSEKLFELELAYDSALKGTNNQSYYDGSLSAIAWKTASQKRHTYSFNYDNWKNLSAANSTDHPYTTEYMYGRNGNINYLKRKDSLGLYQHFEYEYEGTNQLRKLWRKNTEQVEIWPGDANNDGKVEVDDQHPVGFNYKLKAKARDTRSTAWKAFLAIQRKGGDLAFSDTNGDGLINEQDTIAIHQNLLKAHKVEEPKATAPFAYQYDKNGNMVYDQYKKLRITYNIFNLPDTLKVEGRGKIVNQYLADGTLLRRSFFDSDDNELKRIDYQGEFLFVNGKLDKIFTEEGYYMPTTAMSQAKNSSPSGGVGGGKTKKSDYGTYYYTLKDHLGHTRVVIDEEENVIQETAYYPYGGIIAGLSTESKYNYLYTGKEFIDSLGVNWYDHHARYYDPEVGRWFAIDPALQAASPYMAMGNNPMIYIDADGRTWKIFKKIGDALETAWDGFWDAANQFAEWADKAGVPSVNFGAGMGPEGQIQPVGNINGYPLFSNEAQYEAVAQNAVDAINDARSDYNSRQVQASAYQQHITNNILQVGLQQGSYTGGANSQGGDGLSRANNIAGGVGGVGTGASMVDGTVRLTKSGKFSPGYYASGWKGNQYVKTTYSVSKVGNGVATGANVVTTGIAYYQIAGGSAQPITYVDAGVGTAGIIASGASYFYGVQIPVVGEFVAIYGVARVTWDVFYNLGAQYGPSKWYGTNDTRWFK